jgi:hypothetical protein
LAPLSNEACWSIRQKQYALHDCPEADKHDQQSQQVRKPPIGRETIDRPKANCPDDHDDQYANQNRNQPHGMILPPADNSIGKSRATVNGNIGEKRPALSVRRRYASFKPAPRSDKIFFCIRCQLVDGCRSRPQIPLSPANDFRVVGKCD